VVTKLAVLLNLVRVNKKKKKKKKHVYILYEFANLSVDTTMLLQEIQQVNIL